MNTDKCVLGVWARGVTDDFLEKMPEDCCGQEADSWGVRKIGLEWGNGASDRHR